MLRTFSFLETHWMAILFQVHCPIMLGSGQVQRGMSPNWRYKICRSQRVVQDQALSSVIRSLKKMVPLHSRGRLPYPLFRQGAQASECCYLSWAPGFEKLLINHIDQCNVQDSFGHTHLRQGLWHAASSWGPLNKNVWTRWSKHLVGQSWRQVIASFHQNCWNRRYIYMRMWGAHASGVWNVAEIRDGFLGEEWWTQRIAWISKNWILHFESSALLRAMNICESNWNCCPPALAMSCCPSPRLNHRQILRWRKVCAIAGWDPFDDNWGRRQGQDIWVAVALIKFDCIFFIACMHAMDHGDRYIMTMINKKNTGHSRG